ncbi:hypothetical protein [Modestobacter excelsi]|uniref:hypothetical protein n=1 Tax=Modestobacter excelsi TaxID=2213161 RepID=UPI00110D06B5|nr:hypothetical protein [Modestobacter excelsi]
MFRHPLHRDPLVVIWALLMAVISFIALNDNTTWSGHLEADRVAGFLRDVSAALLWSFLMLLLAAWLRSRAGLPMARRPRRSSSPLPPALPWTDRWIRDWREEDAQRQAGKPAEDGPASPTSATCRHGVTLDAEVPAEQTPVLRALSVSHTIVRPGSSVSVTWCFENALDVVVDGRAGQPPCGEALVTIDHSRRVEVVGRNRRATTPVATATVVAMAVPQVDLPTVSAPPPVSLRSDVAATVGTATPITQRLDDFWATQEGLRPQLHAPARLVGVPEPVITRLRRAHRTTGDS